MKLELTMEEKVELLDYTLSKKHRILRSMKRASELAVAFFLGFLLGVIWFFPTSF